MSASPELASRPAPDWIEEIHGVDREDTAVRYSSRGRVLIVGPKTDGMAAAIRLQRAGLDCVVLVPATAVGGRAERHDGIPILRTAALSLDGYLGNFRVTPANSADTGERGRSDGEHEAPFDLVLDLGHTPLLSAEVPPPGYYAAGNAPERLESALAELPALVGEFEKPGYFVYDPSICAHGARGLTGCTRCIDACPTLAIRSIGERIEVDPHLCQGGGACAAACPSGAIRYDVPPPSTLLDALKDRLKVQRCVSSTPPTILFYGRESNPDLLNEGVALPETLVPVALEEIGASGLETWLCALAFGAGGVALLITPDTPRSVRRTLAGEVRTGQRILAALGYPPAALRTLDLPISGIDDLPLQYTDAGIAAPPASFQTFDEKRTNLFLALDHLYRHAPRPSERVALEAGAPFGSVEIDAGACTLCMSCVAVCPSRALSDGGDAPRLEFFEANCVQCGLCVTACPERVLTLEPRLTFEPALRRRARLLKEEEPIRCVTCGKPFATASTVRAVTEKLAGHWMFQDAAARRRLEMCQDCRVRDLFAGGTGGEHAVARSGRQS